MKPTIFLDRDGVLTKEKSYISKFQDLEIFPFAKKCVETIHNAGYFAIVISNQSGIARGLISYNELIRMNDFLKEQTGIDAIYFCPHHPTKGKIPEFSIECDCRKPSVGMIKQACQDFDIDIKNSWMIGDRASDILTAKNAGLKSILVESGYGSARLEFPVTPDYVCSDLQDALGYCL